MKVFTAFALFCVNKLNLPPTESLPLSRDRFGSDSKNADSASSSPLDELVLPVQSRSPFAALSGRADRYTTDEEMVTEVREGLELDRSLLPVVRVDSHRVCPLHLLFSVFSFPTFLRFLFSSRCPPFYILTVFPPFLKIFPTVSSSSLSSHCLALTSIFSLPHPLTSIFPLPHPHLYHSSLTIMKNTLPSQTTFNLLN